LDDRPTIARIWEIAAPVAAEEGLEILDIALHRGGGPKGRTLVVYLDRESSGPTLDELSRVSRQLGDLLDVHEAIEGPYNLEVSSPGVNRPLKKPEHFARFIGKKVRVRTREAIAGRRSFLGVLTEAGAESIALLQEKVEFRVPFSAIEKANYEHDWNEDRTGRRETAHAPRDRSSSWE
jgi:ribosome maturation factor RimP